jgi:hypothetical protein
MEDKFFFINTEDEVCYRIYTYINNSKYEMSFYSYWFNNFKTVRFYISIGSGKKRKETQMGAIEKTNKSDGGLKTLVWCKEMIKKFIEEYESLSVWHKDLESMYLIVQWENNRLREIYKNKLKDLGFYTTVDMGQKCLKLKVR